MGSWSRGWSGMSSRSRGRSRRVVKEEGRGGVLDLIAKTSTNPPPSVSTPPAPLAPPPIVPPPRKSSPPPNPHSYPTIIIKIARWNRPEDNIADLALSPSSSSPSLACHLLQYEAPRHGSLGFLPRKRCVRGRGKVRLNTPSSSLPRCIR